MLLLKIFSALVIFSSFSSSAFAEIGKWSKVPPGTLKFDRKADNDAFEQRTTSELRARLERMKNSDVMVMVRALVVFGGPEFKDSNISAWKSIGFVVVQVKERKERANVYEMVIKAKSKALGPLLHNNMVLWAGTGSQKPTKIICGAAISQLQPKN